MLRVIEDMTTWRIPEYKKFENINDELIKRIELFYSRKNVRLPKISKEKLIDLLEIYFSSDITLTELSKLAGYKSKHTLSKIFSQLGIIPKNCKNKIAIQRKNIEANKFNERYLDKIDNDEKAIILGLYAADGWITNRRVLIELSEKDKHIIYWIKEKFNADDRLITTKVVNNHKINNREIPEYITYKLQLYSKHLYEVMINEYSFSRNKTKNTGIIFKNIMGKFDKHYINSFIYGYYLGDGWFCSNRNVIGFASGDIESMFILQKYLGNLKIKSNVYIRKENDVILTISSKINIERFFKYIIEPNKKYIFIERKIR